MTVAAALSVFRIYTRPLNTFLGRLSLGLLTSLTLTVAFAEPEPAAPSEPETTDSGNAAESTAPLSADTPNADTALAQFIAMVEAGDWPNARVMAEELRDRFEYAPV